MDRRALIIVDYQNDFADPLGSLYVKGGDQLWANIEPLLRVHQLVVLTACWHTREDPSFKQNGGGWDQHCLRGTWGAEFFYKMPPHVGDVILRKTGYSAFNDTGLDGLLRSQWYNDLTITGLALDFCVEATAVQALELGYSVRVPRNATLPVFPEKAASTWTELGRLGAKFE